MRTSWRRTWIKLYPIDCLDGSIRYQLESDERGVWYDLLNFAAICNKPGSIADKDERAYPLGFVANRLNITFELLEKTLAKCQEEGRIKVDDNGIHITNWNAYQSEYNRQKPYRGKKPLSPERKEIELNKYIEELRPQYSDLNFDNELKKFNLYWSEGNRKLKRPKLALTNWMDKARQFKQEKGNGTYKKVITNRPVTDADLEDPEAIAERERLDRELDEELARDRANTGR